jgi:hypothetical protein
MEGALSGGRSASEFDVGVRHAEQYIPPFGRLIPAPWLGRDAMLWGSRRQNDEKAW